MGIKGIGGWTHAAKPSKLGQSFVPNTKLPPKPKAKKPQGGKGTGKCTK
jgi:hypothetical protein